MSTQTLPNYSELTPAYGRDYKSAAEVKAAFLSGERDFVYAAAGLPTNIKDGYIAAGTTVLLRYKRLTMVTSLKITKAHLDALDG